MNRPPKTKLIAVLGGAFLAASTLASQAAGLGKLSVNSALGQPLSAEIELASLQPGEFEALTARVASPDAYGDAKIEYVGVLRQLKFAVDRRSDGKPILKVTSQGPVNEPFLDVLVEMTWPAGRLLREYPILLDPPGFNEARVAPQVAVAVVTPATAAPEQAAPATAPATAAGISPATGSPSAKAESGADSYGPVKRGDTLSKIAGELKTDTVSLEQMLVALYRENKAAFVKNNMNLLRTGQILKIPSAEEIGKIPQGDAQKEIRVQVADWKSYRDQLAGSAGASPASPKAGNEATGKIAVAKPDKPAPAAATGDQLKIAKSDVSAKAGSAGAKGSQDQVNAMKEELVAKENQTKEANSRVKDLEKQIGDMRKLMELKAIPAPKAAEPAKPEPAKPAAETKVAAVTPPPVVAPTQTPAATEAAKPAETSKPATVNAEAKPAAPKAVAKAAPTPEPDFLDEWGLVAGGVGVAVAGAGGLFAFVRRRKKAAGGSTSQLSTSSVMPSDLRPNSITGSRAGGLVDTGNSSFLTDFDKAGPGNIDTDEVDPVAEAEVYIAYGRDAQAEEILKEAMTRDKSRHEIALKLLEIYHNRKSAPAFETVARELKDAVGTDNPMWAKAAAMGAAIDPSNKLYGGAGGEAFAATSKFTAGGAAEPAAAPAPDLDFDLGFSDSPSAPASSASFDVTSPNTDQSAAPAASFDLDLNTSPAAESGEQAPAADGGLDFDLALDAPAAAAPAPAAAAPAEDSGGFDFDLSALSLDQPGGGAPAKAEAPAAPSMALDLGGLSLDLDAPAAAPAPAAPAGGGDGSSAVSTKLELAKAYIEIGDSDGAKEILNEVAREGSPAQQEEAKQILAGL